MIEFRYVDTRTERGLIEAENLKEEGWVLGPVGFWTLQFSRDGPNRSNPSLSPHKGVKTCKRKTKPKKS